MSESNTKSTGESICTKYADLVSQYESLVDSQGRFVDDSWSDTFGTDDALIELGELEPDTLMTEWERVERMANSSIGRNCFSESLKDAINAYVKR